MNLHEGQVIGQYVIRHLLGTGGMGSVWRAWDTKNGRDVAIKVIADEMANDPAYAARFMDEIRRHGRLVHPNIVNILDTFRLGGRACMVMSLITRGSVATLLDRAPQRRVSIAIAVPIIKDVLAALDHAHQHGVFHRDVKPSNILLDGSNNAYLADFGIALALGEERRTRYGLPVGTAEYMSPEQIRTPKHIDHRTDVYSVGCVLYEMLTGRPPFIAGDLDGGGDSDIAIRSAHVNRAPLPPTQRVPSLPGQIDRLIMSALSKNPDDRVPGCAEFSRLLLAASNSPNPSIRSTSIKQPKHLLVIAGLFATALATLLYVVAH
jgi:eukaryotic-like serine/threonine-protein kinase